MQIAVTETIVQVLLRCFYSLPDFRGQLREEISIIGTTLKKGEGCRQRFVDQMIETELKA